MMHVLHISAGNLYGGVETLLLTLARQCDLCPEMTPRFAVCFEGRLSAELRRAGVSVDCLGEVRVRWPWTVVRARRRLKEVFNRHPCDVVVCHSVWAQAIFGPAARSAGMKLVCWLHAAPKGTHWLERWAKRVRPDGVICNSRFTAAHLANLYPGVRAEVIHCPVEPFKTSEVSKTSEVCDASGPASKIQAVRRVGKTSVEPVSPARQEPRPPELSPGHPLSAARQGTRDEMKVAPETIVIIQVSRIEPLKGHRLHLEALAKLVDLPGWECWFVGGAQRASEERSLEEIKQAALRLGIGERVRFLGQRADVGRLLSAADIYCQPNSSPDSFGITFIEAMLAGLPVATTAMGGALEIVDPSCGILVPLDDPAALADCLRRLILDPQLRSHLGESGPDRARRLCDPSQQMTRIFDFFRRVAIRDVAA